MNVLAFGAHPDDLEYFCAGTLARCARRGDHVVMAVVTDGRNRPAGDPDAIAAIRRQEAQASADVIGAELAWMGIPDGGLEVPPEHRDKFVQVIRAAEPDLILTHFPQDYHPDHMITSQLTMYGSQNARSANYPSPYPPLRKTVPFAFYDSELGLGFEPEDYVDIGETFDLKMAMLRQHKTQAQPSTAPYDPAFVVPEDEFNIIVRPARVMSEFRGLACGVQYAEGFRWWRQANRVLPARLLP